MKISEINREYLIGYLRLDEPEETEIHELDAALVAGKAYIKSYTGLSEEEMESHEDLSIALSVLVADMYENKNRYLDYKNKETNKTVDTILGMHARNLV